MIIAEHDATSLLPPLPHLSAWTNFRWNTSPLSFPRPTYALLLVQLFYEGGDGLANIVVGRTVNFIFDRLVSWPRWSSMAIRPFVNFIENIGFVSVRIVAIRFVLDTLIIFYVIYIILLQKLLCPGRPRGGGGNNRATVGSHLTFRILWLLRYVFRVIGPPHGKLQK